MICIKHKHVFLGVRSESRGALRTALAYYFRMEVGGKVGIPGSGPLGDTVERVSCGLLEHSPKEGGRRVHQGECTQSAQTNLL